MKYTEEQREKSFLDKIHKTETCWFWIGAKTGSGYGAHKFRGIRAHLAHRESYIRYKGEITKGMFIMHSCDNPGCVNPEHLTAGTPKENYRDAMRKGRVPEIHNKGARALVCRNGHDKSDPNNILECTDGKFRCKICNMASHLRYKIAKDKRRKEQRHAQVS